MAGGGGGGAGAGRALDGAEVLKKSAQVGLLAAQLGTEAVALTGQHELLLAALLLLRRGDTDSRGGIATLGGGDFVDGLTHRLKLLAQAVDLRFRLGDVSLGARQVPVTGSD